MNDLIITVAVTGAETTRAQCPALPITAVEIAEDTARCYEAGATVVHLHVRRDDGTPTQDAGIFARAIEEIRKRCPILIETTTGGAVGMSDDERLQPIPLHPTMASLDCGSVNFSDEVLLNSLPQMRIYAERMNQYGVKPTLECFDLGHINNGAMLIGKGLLKPPYHFSLVMGVPGGVPATARNLAFMAESLPPESLWTAIAVGGKASALLHPIANATGGHVRVGFEDNIYLKKGVVAKSNADFVRHIADLSERMGRKVANLESARAQFGLT